MDDADRLAEAMKALDQIAGTVRFRKRHWWHRREPMAEHMRDIALATLIHLGE